MADSIYRRKSSFAFRANLTFSSFFSLSLFIDSYPASERMLRMQSLQIYSLLVILRRF